jgi:predicted ATP-grasp superfamily ATP-dependent carboligase
MNANELANLMIQFDSGRIYEHAEEIANMLRKQQEEIEYWKEMFEKSMTEVEALQNVLRKAQEK